MSNCGWLRLSETAGQSALPPEPLELIDVPAKRGEDAIAGPVHWQLAAEGWFKVQMPALRRRMPRHALHQILMPPGPGKDHAFHGCLSRSNEPS
jgi:hypothetical protein